MPSRWGPSGMGLAGRGYEARGSGIFPPGTNMSVHRGDQRGGQGRTLIPTFSRLRASPEPAPSGCPITVAHRDGDIGTAAEVGTGWDFRATTIQSAVPKSKAPAKRNAPGLLMSRGGAGGWWSARHSSKHRHPMEHSQIKFRLFE
jgi:hypothetical protein